MVHEHKRLVIAVRNPAGSFYTWQMSYDNKNTRFKGRVKIPITFTSYISSFYVACQRLALVVQKVYQVFMLLANCSVESESQGKNNLRRKDPNKPSQWHFKCSCRVTRLIEKQSVSNARHLFCTVFSDPCKEVCAWER